MKKILVIFILSYSILAHSQESEYNKQTLAESFNQKPAGNRKDFCTSRLIKIDLIFSGEIQRVTPERAIKLNRILKDCGQEQTQDWTGGTTEMFAIENEIEYWLQIDKPADHQVLNKIKKDDQITVYGKLICEHLYDSTNTFFIINKIKKK